MRMGEVASLNNLTEMSLWVELAYLFACAISEQGIS